MTLLETALSYRQAGRSVIPTGKDKRPTIKQWKPFQSTIPDESKLKAWFPKNKHIAIITGRVSGNLEIIDFDYEPGRPNVFQDWRDLLERKAPGLFERLTIQGTQNNGFHAAYLCFDTEIPGNQKLAQWKNGEEIKTLIETRGEGGYFLASPSPGYKLYQGTFANPAEITKDERQALIDCALMLNEFIEPQQVTNGPERTKPKGNGLSPGDDFNERADLPELLSKHGWVAVRGGNKHYQRYRRPGKKQGSSASLIDGKTFYNFSSNAHLFKPFTGYSPFAVYTLLEHGGDYSAAAKELSRQDYGGPLASRTSSPDMSYHPAFANENQAPKQKEILTFDTLRTKYEGGTVEFIWREHIFAGMPIIVNGREGVGKTTNCAQMAKEILDEYPNNSVIWIASEGFIKDTIHKFEHLGVDGSRLLILENQEDEFTFNFAIPKERKILDNYLTQAAAQGIPTICVFIDSIRGISHFDDNESKIKNVMMPLNSIVCDKHNAALVYLDHQKKGRADSLLDKGVGTTAKGAAVRAIYSIGPASHLTRSIKCAKVNVLGHEPVELKSAETSRGIVIYEAAQKINYTMLNKAEKYLIEIFSKRSEYLVSDIYQDAEEQGISVDILRKAKQKLNIDAVRSGSLPSSPWKWKCDGFL